MAQVNLVHLTQNMLLQNCVKNISDLYVSDCVLKGYISVVTWYEIIYTISLLGHVDGVHPFATKFNCFGSEPTRRGGFPQLKRLSSLDSAQTER